MSVKEPQTLHAGWPRLHAKCAYTHTQNYKTKKPVNARDTGTHMLTRTHSTRSKMENQLKCIDPSRQTPVNGSHTQWGMTMLQARNEIWAFGATWVEMGHINNSDRHLMLSLVGF